MITQIKHLATITFSLTILSSACTLKHVNDEIKTISEKDWEIISDTADIISSTIKYSHMENCPESGPTIYDWTEGFKILHSKKYEPYNKIKTNSISGIDFSSRIEQPCIHEKDTVAFSMLLDSLFINGQLSDSCADIIKLTLSKAYKGNYFFKNERASCDTFFHIVSKNRKCYIKFSCELGASQLDSLCGGTVTIQNKNSSATFTSNIYGGDLVLFGKLETYIISDNPIASIQDKLINHMKYRQESVYYFVNQSKVKSSIASFDGRLRSHKVLVSFL